MVQIMEEIIYEVAGDGERNGIAGPESHLPAYHPTAALRPPIYLVNTTRINL